MTKKVYTINKGVDKPIAFRGLRAQWIMWLAGALIGDFLLFVILFIGGLNSWICVIVALGLGTGSVIQIYRLNNKYGEHGLMKKSAARHIPGTLRTFSRKKFIQLKRSSSWKKN